MKYTEAEQEELQKTIEETQKKEEQKKKKVKAVKIVGGIALGIAGLGIIARVLLPNDANDVGNETSEETNITTETSIKSDIVVWENIGVGDGEVIKTYNDFKSFIKTAETLGANTEPLTYITEETFKDNVVVVGRLSREKCLCIKYYTIYIDKNYNVEADFEQEDDISGWDGPMPITLVQVMNKEEIEKGTFERK